MANPIRVNRTHFNNLVNDNAKLSGAAFTGDVSVTGDLHVTGTTTRVINLDITDNLIGLNNGLTGSNTNDSGILIGRGQDENAFMGWGESENKFTMGLTNANATSSGNITLTTGTLIANLEGNVTGALTGNAATATTATTAATATKLASAVNIGGVSFDGSADIDLSGVNVTGTQDTTGNAATATTAATATKLASAVNIGGVSFDGSADIDLSGVNVTGTQDTTGNAATATTALTVTEAAQAAITSVGTLTGLTMADEGDIAVNATTGTKIGTATTQKLGFFNATPVAQPAAAAQAAVTSQSLSDTAAGTYTQAHITKIQTELNDVTALANEMRTVLVNLGLMRGSA